MRISRYIEGSWYLDASKSVVYEDNTRALFYFNSLFVKTFKTGTTDQ